MIQYALDYPVCVGDRRLKYGRGQRAALLNHILGSNSKIKEAIGLDVDGSYEPCEDDYATSYMNRADVKTAIHVKGDIEWAGIIIIFIITIIIFIISIIISIIVIIIFMCYDYYSRYQKSVLDPLHIANLIPLLQWYRSTKNYLITMPTIS
jgi:hypothetical protein